MAEIVATILIVIGLFTGPALGMMLLWWFFDE